MFRCECCGLRNCREKKHGWGYICDDCYDHYASAGGWDEVPRRQIEAEHARMRGEERAVLVGGPYGGREVTVPVGRDVWRMPAPPKPMTFIDSDDSDLYPGAALPMLDYRVLLDAQGRPSRDDAGRLIYELYVPGRSSHSRCKILVLQDGPDDWPAMVMCRCGVALSVPSQAVLDDFQARHLLIDPTYGRRFNEDGTVAD